jgi:hypothetical protein
MLQSLQDGYVASFEDLARTVVPDDHLARPRHDRTIRME